MCPSDGEAVPALRDAGAQGVEVDPREGRREVRGVGHHEAHALVLDQPPQGAVRPRRHRQPGREVLERLVRQRGVEVGGVEPHVEGGPAEVVRRQRPQQRRRLQGVHHPQPGRARRQLAVGGGVAVGEDVDREARRGDRREVVAEVVVAAVGGEAALVDDPRRPGGRRAGAGAGRQVALERVVREQQDGRPHVVAGLQLGEHLERHGDESVAALDGRPLQRQRVLGVVEAVLVRGPPQALHVVRVVDHRDVAPHGLERQHRQQVGEVVAVDQVGAEVLDGAGDRVGGVARGQAPPAVEELVTRPVPLGEGPPLEGEPEGHVLPAAAASRPRT